MSTTERTDTSRAFQDRWAQVRPPGALVPEFSDIELSDFAEFLPLLSILEVDTVTRTVPFRFVGSFVRSIVGFELTGTCCLDYIDEVPTEASWQNRLIAHDHPCGRFEVMNVRFPGGVLMKGTQTSLPIAGAGHKRLLLVLSEPMEKPPHLKSDEIANGIVPATTTSFLDIGAGIPSRGLGD